MDYTFYTSNCSIMFNSDLGSYFDAEELTAGEYEQLVAEIAKAPCFRSERGFADDLEYYEDFQYLDDKVLSIKPIRMDNRKRGNMPKDGSTLYYNVEVDGELTHEEAQDLSEFIVCAATDYQESYFDDKEFLKHYNDEEDYEGDEWYTINIITDYSWTWKI